MISVRLETNHHPNHHPSRHRPNHRHHHLDNKGADLEVDLAEERVELVWGDLAGVQGDLTLD
ncbi:MULTISPECIES: hypothetical protein [Aerococcus]|uniref:hypothetical protein n=1 Tax=Aerococcus TaxID=1375 RepID=UPI000DCB9514|nr:MULTISPECIES: hypothetical protein [Aerococcus]KAA9234459.1 hypothetical protein F6I37_03375 [Aerococcus mictus]MDK6292016.1 hypothetical protein [Aerococcus urinae]MDK6374452.1 hypothetical protein [Aerococcus urinae]MDK6420532.1 hypothetical protein [Aerococcus urinae]MDK8075088.1 hypothetical protein [Aerococcus urinae]